MYRSTLACVLLLAVSPALAADPPAVAKKTHQVRLNGHTFTLPQGFTVEQVAGPPLADRPIVADFDEQGRLYVADSSGSNEKVQEQLAKKPHRIVRLEDADGDGKFDKSVVFADKMMFPEGAMWYAGSLYVSAPPSIWKLTDTDGDGVADQREEWFKGKTLTGCANDLHGPYLGPDGWIYWCKGAFAEQTYPRPGKPPLVTKAAHIFRCRPDGTGIEPVMTGGMDNPVDVVFTPGGERIFTTTFLQHPGGGKRDGLIHAVYGGIYGKDWDPIYSHPWTGPSVMPVLTHLGAAAPCGLARYESRVFGPEYQDNLFACLFNMHKVTRHVLTPDGATFKTQDEDFLVSDNLDFHPTDVLEDADGSLLVIDTGGWYKLCCPTSQLHKPDVLGAIYRVRRKDAAKIDDPRGLKLDWAKSSPKELTKLLDDPRPAVRQRAMGSLATKGKDAFFPLMDLLDEGSSQARRNAVWTACRMDHISARFVVRFALRNDDESARQAAIHAAGLWRDAETATSMWVLLRKPSLHNRRAAAEALGRIGGPHAVPALLEALADNKDRVLEHSLTYALIEIGDRGLTLTGATFASPDVRRACLVALDQMPGGNLPADKVAVYLNSSNAELKETAWWIVSRHPEWGDTLAGVLRDRLAARDLPPAERQELPGRLARFARTPAVQGFLAERLRDAESTRDARRIVLQAMAQANLKEAPETWVAGVTQVMAGDDAELVREAVNTARFLRVPKQRAEPLAKGLLQVGGNATTPIGVRLAALAAVPGGLTRVEPALFDLLLVQLRPESPVAQRSAAADVLSRAKLSSGQLLTLAVVIQAVGPLEIDRLLEPFAQSTDEPVGLGLIAALKESAARSNLRVEQVRTRLAKYSPAVQKQAEELYAALDADLAGQKAKLEELLADLKDGDVRRGQAVFHSQKAACASCHAIGYLGGNLGPDLTRIGGIRNERDLLESIVFPNASFVRSYEPVTVTTKAGRVFNGLVRKDAPDEIVLATSATEEARIARDDVEEVQPGKVSVMPAGLDQQLTRRDLADLVAFLKACR